MSSGEIVVGWKALLTINSPAWHDSVSTVIAAYLADGYFVREAELVEYADSSASIDILVIVYLAVQHERIRDEEYLMAALAEVKCNVRSILLCAVDRGNPKDEIEDFDAGTILDSQASIYGLDRFGYRTPSTDDLSSLVRNHLESLLRMSTRSFPRDESIDPAIDFIHEEVDEGNYA